MTNKLMVLALVFTALIISCFGCKRVALEQGQIPEAYLTEAERFVGSYFGEFNGVRGSLNISLENQRLVLTYQNAFGRDLLDPRCHSSVGNLEEVEFTEVNGEYEVASAEFTFDPGFCSDLIQGQRLRVGLQAFDGELELQLSLLEQTRWSEECQSITGSDGQIELKCQQKPQPTYLSGVFHPNHLIDQID